MLITSYNQAFIGYNRIITAYNYTFKGYDLLTDVSIDSFIKGD